MRATARRSRAAPQDLARLRHDERADRGIWPSEPKPAPGELTTRYLDALERQPEVRADSDILRLNLAEMVARRLGPSSQDASERLEQVALAELRAARTRDDWARVRDNVIDRVLRIYLPLTGGDGEGASAALAARLHRLTAALSSQDEIETVWRATRFLLAATPFDQRRGLWDLHLRLRSRV